VVKVLLTSRCLLRRLFMVAIEGGSLAFNGRQLGG
jgi:hypothetical protein